MDSTDIKLKVFVQPTWCKTHKETDLYLPNDNLNGIKRKLLSAVKAPTTNLEKFAFSLQYFGHDMPIVHEDDFYHMLGDMLQDPEKLVAINVKKVAKRRVKKQFAFDEVGTVNPTLENEGDVVLNRPSDKMYDGKEEVFCAFCRISNRNKAVIKDVGPFYGPFKNKQKPFYVHEMCAIWTPEIYLDKKTNKMKNLLKEVKRCNKMFCSYCGGLGGGLGCLNKGCKKTYHFRCLLDDKIDCQLNYNEFTMLCPEHVEKEDDIDIENMFCKVCDKGDDEDKMIICDKCLKGYHMYCLDPPLTEVPQDKWFCDLCVNTSDPVHSDHEESQGI